MSVKATIIIDDQELNVLWFTYAYNRRVDMTGRPTTRSVFLGLDLAIETRKTLNLADWSFSPTQTKEIELHIAPIILGGRTRTIKFYDCYLLKWDNHFSSRGATPMHEVLHISAGGVKDSISSAEYSASWRKTYEHNDVEPTTLYDDEPEIVDCYYTDLEGNEQAEPIAGEEVYLVLKTKNATGEIMDIDLSNHSKDFIYKDAIIENDIIKDFSVTSDLHKIKLKVITQQEEPIKSQKS